ncbi:MAG: hypothetical protein ACHQKY_15365, partial [Terriglobia bacterium]
EVNLELCENPISGEIALGTIPIVDKSGRQRYYLGLTRQSKLQAMEPLPVAWEFNIQSKENNFNGKHDRRTSTLDDTYGCHQGQGNHG